MRHAVCGLGNVKDVKDHIHTVAQKHEFHVASSWFDVSHCLCCITVQVSFNSESRLLDALSAANQAQSIGTVATAERTVSEPMQADNLMLTSFPSVARYSLRVASREFFLSRDAHMLICC